MVVPCGSKVDQCYDCGSWVNGMFVQRMQDLQSPWAPPWEKSQSPYRLDMGSELPHFTWRLFAHGVTLRLFQWPESQIEQLFLVWKQAMHVLTSIHCLPCMFGLHADRDWNMSVLCLVIWCVIKQTNPRRLVLWCALMRFEASHQSVASLVSVASTMDLATENEWSQSTGKSGQWVGHSRNLAIAVLGLMSGWWKTMCRKTGLKPTCPWTNLFMAHNNTFANSLWRNMQL